MKTYADFPPGSEFQTPGRTVTEADIGSFAGLTGDFYPLHVDETYASKTQFGQRIAHGPLVYSLAVGLMFQSGVFEDSILAFLGVESMRHLAPCFIGDTVAVLGTVTDSRVTSDTERAVVRIRYDVHAVNDGRHLMTAELAFLMQAIGTRDAVGTSH